MQSDEVEWSHVIPPRLNQGFFFGEKWNISLKHELNSISVLELLEILLFYGIGN